MPPTIQADIFNLSITQVFIKFTTLIILVFYAIFALMIIRQVDLMGKTLITRISPTVKAISIIHAGFAIGLIILAFGLL